MPARARASDVAARATFVFEGTVRKLGSATMPDVPVNARTAVVRVDRVLRAPPALAGHAGQDITVQIGPGAMVKRGQRAVFYTEGARFGVSVVVQSLAHTDVDRAVPATPDRELEDHVADADLVVRGRVARVRLSSSARRTVSTPRAPVSEHAPLWHEAVIDVDEVGKGRSPRREVVVRFASSSDVRWRGAPKLQPGQEGVFLLHKADAPTYEVLHPEDVQPSHAAPEILALARSRPRARRAARRPRH